MFLRTLFLTLSLILTCINLAAQYDASEASPSNRSSVHFPDLLPASVTIKFSLEDGVLITAAPSVRSNCRSVGLFLEGLNRCHQVRRASESGGTGLGASSLLDALFRDDQFAWL